MFAVLGPACAKGDVLLWLKALRSLLLLVRGKFAGCVLEMLEGHGNEELTLVSMSWSDWRYPQVVSVVVR